MHRIACLTSSGSLSTKKPIITGHFGGKWPINIRHRMLLCHSVAGNYFPHSFSFLRAKKCVWYVGNNVWAPSITRIFPFSYVFICMYIYVYIYIYIYIYIYVYTYVCLYVYICMYMYIYIYVYICIYIYEYTCMYMYICICISLNHENFHLW